MTGVEAIDVGATYGVLSMGAADRAGTALLFLAERAGEIEMANGLRVVAQHGTGA